MGLVFVYVLYSQHEDQGLGGPKTSWSSCRSRCSCKPTATDRHTQRGSRRRWRARDSRAAAPIGLRAVAGGQAGLQVPASCPHVSAVLQGLTTYRDLVESFAVVSWRPTLWLLHGGLASSSRDLRSDLGHEKGRTSWGTDELIKKCMPGSLRQIVS
jgi:hypothetical protein